MSNFTIRFAEKKINSGYFTKSFSVAIRANFKWSLFKGTATHALVCLLVIIIQASDHRPSSLAMKERSTYHIRRTL